MQELSRRAAEKSAEIELLGKRDLERRDAADFLKNRPLDQIDPWVSFY